MCIAGSIYAGYMLFNKGFNDNLNYNFEKNSIGQMLFVSCVILSILNFLKIIQQERLFPKTIIVLSSTILIYYFKESIFLLQSFVTVIISLIVFSTRKFLHWPKQSLKSNL